MGANDHWGEAILTPGAWFAEIIKRILQIMKALGLVFSVKKIFPMTPPRRGLYGPQGHGWQDL